MTREEIDAVEPTMLPLGQVTLVDRGAGPALLLLHGNGRTWRGLSSSRTGSSGNARC